MDWKYYKPKFEYEKDLKDIGWPWAGHKSFGYDLVRNLKPKRVVELGTHFGTSFFSFCQAAKDGSIDAELFAVDTWEGDKHAGFYGDEVFDKVIKLKNKYYSDQEIKLLRKTFNEAVEDFADESIDLLHIDGLHTYEGVKHDYESWIKKVRKNGVVLFHDIFVKETDFGVYKLWDELKKKHPSIEFSHSYGLGALFLDKKIGTELKKKEKDLQMHYAYIFGFRQYMEIEGLRISIEEKERIIPEKNELISELSESIQKEEKELQRKDQEIDRKNKQLEELKSEIRQKDQVIHQKDLEIESMRSSKFWKARGMYLRAKSFRPSHFFEIAGKGIKILKKEGIRKFLWSLYKYFIHGRKYFRKRGELVVTSGLTEYEAWIQKNENLDEEKISEEINGFSKKPRISIVMIVSDADEIFLRKAIFSVINQYYQNWELRIIGNAPRKIAIKKILEQFEKKDARIKVDLSEKQEVFSEAANKAIEAASGEFVSLVGQDDTLAPNAFYEAVKSVNSAPDSDLIYSDEDKINEDEIRFDHNFKPDWSPELVISQGYIGNIFLVKKEIFQRIGGFRNGFRGAEMYDFFLRLLEITDNALHIPKILYHKRIFPWQRKSFASVEGGRLALESYMKRRMIKGKAKIPDFALENDVMNYKMEFNPDDFAEKVTIIIPTKDKTDLLERCIKSIREKTLYRNYEILVVDNNSEEKKTFDFFEKEKIKYIKIPTDGFNYSKIHNVAVRNIASDLILLLNNDTEVISPGWLTAMVGTILTDREIGAVGARLIYGDKNIQHAGVIVGPLSTADHANKNIHFEEGGYQNYNLVMRNYSAVTAACMLTRKSLFEKVGGLDEKNMAVAFNDVDYCLKLIKSGYRIVYNPDALLYHHESKSRGENHKLEEPRYFTRKWKRTVEQDPYGNPNLSLEDGRFMLKNK